MRRRLSYGFAKVAVLAPLAMAWAHGGATGIVKERMDFMVTVGKAMDGMAKMLRGRIDYDPEAMRRHAETLAGHGDERLTALFPEGALDPPTEALPAIWDDWSEFQAQATRMTVVAEAMRIAADNPRSTATNADLGLDAAGLAAASPDVVFRNLAATCQACHAKFRKEK